MILPIRALGDPILRTKAKEITDADKDMLPELIENMRETMKKANGIGLAAPQVGYSLRIFVADLRVLAQDEDYEDIADVLASFNKVFINPIMIEETGTEWKFNEGCLSIPDVREDVARKENILLLYQDENFVEHEERFSGIFARVIQHEYDHLEGILFIDHLSSFKKKILKGKLSKINTGNIQVSYSMRFPK